MTRQEEMRIIKGTEHAEEFNPVTRKQGEIREGIENRLCSLLMLCGEPPQKARDTAKELVEAWFKWMASQGVAIRIKGELPVADEEMLKRLNYKVDLMSPARGAVLEAYILAEQDMCEAGYVATIPLIDTVKLPKEA